MSDDSYSISGLRYLNCEASLKEGSGLCVSCGYHLEKKQILTTKPERDHSEEESPHAETRKKRKKKKYLFGILDGGNAIAICTLIGFLLGVVIALVLGTLFPAGNERLPELSIYVFCSGLSGIGIGGGAGYVLSSKLPNYSSEYVSEQLWHGLFRVMSGFVLIGCGLMAFGIYEEMLEKWGLLILCGGIGLARLGLGIRAMIPQEN